MCRRLRCQGFPYFHSANSMEAELIATRPTSIRAMPSMTITASIPTAAERANPERAMGSMRKELATVRIQPGASEPVRVRIPTPGYIVAPIALTVDAQPCR